MGAGVTIPLATGGETIVSPEDAHIVSSKRWFLTHADSRRGGYVQRSERIGGKRQPIYLHRLIANARRGEIVDHINGNGLDNRRENLRIATAQLNSVNRRSYTPSSGYRGVVARGNRWQASISIKRRFKSLGYFGDAESAARAYDAAAIAEFGEFAVLNFPPALRLPVDSGGLAPSARRAGAVRADGGLFPSHGAAE